jgi:hypothetical protein
MHAVKEISAPKCSRILCSIKEIYQEKKDKFICPIVTKLKHFGTAEN